ncbi:MAG: sigma-70 family RNA polymerase sigma factor [Phycisphaerales bacterium]|nr:sigma-70 family RNA polymerase sigma factor [Phycisphaerales bacterium]
MPPDQDDVDQQLMRRVAQGDRAALGDLVRRHQERVLALATRFLGDAILAEDVCQETFLRVMRSAAAYQPTARFTTWLYRIVANLSWDQRRRARRAPRPAPTDAMDEPASVGLEGAELRETVRQAVAALPERQRLALVLHRYHGMSHADIAAATGWSQSAVESCLVRAYATLRGSLTSTERT